MIREPPEEPERGDDQITFPALGVTLYNPPYDGLDQIRTFEPEEGSMPPEVTKQLIREAPREMVQQFYADWIEHTFESVVRPVRLFNTGEVEKNNRTFEVVRKDTFGNQNRPVLDQTTRSRRHIERSALAVSMQYAATSDAPPREVADEIPFDLSTFEVVKLREFVEGRDYVWAEWDDAPWWRRTPIGDAYELNGILYFMFVIRDDTFVPRYIGISQKEPSDTGLGWAFRDATRRGVQTRWGYQRGQHLGELSAAMFPAEYNWEPKPKYERWKDELFIQGQRVLRETVYLEVVPWLSDNLLIAEENMVMLSEYLYPGTLLNVEYAGQIDPEQTRLGQE